MISPVFNACIIHNNDGYTSSMRINNVVIGNFENMLCFGILSGTTNIICEWSSNHDNFGPIDVADIPMIIPLTCKMALFTTCQHNIDYWKEKENHVLQWWINIFTRNLSTSIIFHLSGHIS
jgi:hypothetical protein